jgi:Lon protease-like protein
MEHGMADELFEVPLFPLHVVLFPGMALPLHIFEPRYREMTAACLADRAPFGVVLTLPEGEQLREKPAQVGTFARIADYERLPDGCYNLLTLGTQRFAIAEMRGSKSYLTGLVRPLRDREESDAAARPLVPDARESLRQYLRLVMTLIGSEERRIAIPEDACELSFLIGMCLTDDDDKQRLLEMTSVVERLRRGVLMLRDEVQVLAQQVDEGHSSRSKPDRSILN